MFTQPQLSCVVSEGTVLTHHKKRKLDHHHYASSDVVSSTTSAYESTGSGASTNGTSVNYRRQNAHIKSSPSNNSNQQSFIRASTIKLLDSYTRCGQKVGFLTWFYFHPFFDTLQIGSLIIWFDLFVAAKILRGECRQVWRQLYHNNHYHYQS